MVHKPHLLRNETVNATRGTGGSQQQVNIVNAIPVRIAGVTTLTLILKQKGLMFFQVRL